MKLKNVLLPISGFLIGLLLSFMVIIAIAYLTGFLTIKTV
jgi:hypothetical protein